jgi:excisionase family DNA binding protein
MSNTLYSKNDLADMLKLSVSTIDNKMNAGEIQYYKIGKSVRFDDNMVTEFLQKQTGKMYQRKLFSHKHKDKDVTGLANAFGMVK